MFHVYCIAEEKTNINNKEERLVQNFKSLEQLF